ncbi:MAG TPA: hypothetical protein VD828_04345 [Candidatus Nitrosotenuis sp.]|nr:hypothetical protein [Candidatus Nitrosotenuis sp.]
MVNLGKLFLQIRYDCNPQDKQNLESLQKQIQERIDFLNEQNLDSYGDPKLLENYELYAQIQECLFENHADQYILIAVIITGISLLVYIRWWTIKRTESKN